MNDSILPEIPVLDVGRDWPVETLDYEMARTQRMLDESAAGYPEFALKLGDMVSRRWLAKWDNPRLEEIDRISEKIGRPGAYFLNISYEWGCTSRVSATSDGKGARLARVLDWPFKGLGRHVMAARVSHGPAPWVTLTWPGFTGVLHAMAPGRFSAALNQAPMERPLGFLPIDWTLNRKRLWSSPHPTPAHLLRQVFEEAEDYAAAKDILTNAPIALPTLYILSGIAPDEGCVIERLQRQARVFEIPASTANDWQTPEWRGHVRGTQNAERVEDMNCALIDADDDFTWLKPPIMNEFTRLAFIADARTGRCAALGVEDQAPATQVLTLEFEDMAG